MIDTAMLLAAGFGTRMRPLSDNCPKPLLKLANKCLIDWTLDRLRLDGISRFIINSHYLFEQITSHFADQNDVQIIYEKQILETGGGVKNALSLLGDKPFFVVNTDTIITNAENINDNGKNLSIVKQMQKIWYDKINHGNIDLLLLLHDRKMAFGYDGKGDFDLDDKGFIKRRQKNMLAEYVFTGTQIIDPCIFENSPDGAFSLNILYDKAITKGRLKSVINNGGWYHIGTVKNLKSASTIFSNK